MADYPVRVTGTIGPTPQNPVTGAMARGLRSLQQLASQYQVLPQVPLLGGTSVDELLSLPGAASLMEDISYQGPRALIKGGNLATGGIGTFRLDPRLLDAADVATLAAPVVGVGVKGAVQGTKALGRLAAEGVERAVQSRNPLVAAVQPAYVVKPRGGNWAQRDVEATMIDPLKREQTPILSGELVNEAAGRDLFSEYRKVYDQDPTVGLHDWMRTTHPDIYAGMHEPNALALNKWLDTKLTRYIKNEMGTPEDPVRALAERGVLHFQPREATARAAAHRNVARRAAQRSSSPTDFRPDIAGESRLARNWEDVADSAILPGTYRDFVSEYAEPERMQNALRGIGGEYAVKNPDVIAYAMNRGRGAPDVGFDHLVDELKNAMAPDSILPANLRLTPDKLEKVTVPQAVELVDKINKWRSAEAAKAEKLGMMQNLQAAPRAVDEGLQLSFVEKPGAVWVDIPETVSEKGMKLCTTIGKQGGWCTQSESLARSYGSGENRLVAMLDADGRPHVQAKITRDVDQMSAFDAAVESFTPAQEAAWGRHFDALEGSPGLGDALEWMKDNAPDAYKNYLQILQSQPNVKPPDITELKPVANSFRSDRAQEYAQRDPNYFRQIESSVLKFLNEGQWGRVADLDHYGIIDAQDSRSLMQGLTDLYADESARAAPRAAIDAFNAAVGSTPNAPRFMTQRQLREFIGNFEPLEGYAEGGLVGLHNKYQAGGLVKTSLVKVFNSLKTMLSGEAPAAAREAAETTAAAPVREQKMLQGFYRGYAGDYDANKAAQEAGMVFVTPQRAVGELYANKRAGQMNTDPHLEMILADPFAGYGYGHSTLGTGKNPPMTTKARQLAPEDIKERTPLYAEGGAVEFDPDKIDRMAAEILSQQPVKVGEKPVIFKNPDEILARQGRLQTGPLSLSVVRSPRGADARLGLAVAPGLEPFADVDPIRRELTQYGVQYEQPLRDDGINARFAVDPKSNAKMLAGAYRKQIGKDSELSAQGAYVTGAGKPSYNVGVQYRKRFAAGGAVEFDSDKIEAMAAQLSEELYA